MWFVFSPGYVLFNQVNSTTKRRRTFDLEEASSPGVKVMLESMKDEMTTDEMKDSLMNVIDKAVEEKSEYLMKV